MTKIICPTITASTPHEYRAQLERVQPLSKRLHIDLADGTFASPRSVGLHQVHWPGGHEIDLHVMYQHPLRYLKTIRKLKPQLVILHAEAEGDFAPMARKLHACGIAVGLALLPNTTVTAIKPALGELDHLLIFSGNLGHQGGSKADMSLLEKVRQVRALKPELEIGWDGGVNADNVRTLFDAGVDVLDVGGFIQHADDPAMAYATLKTLAD